jgi:hypothetical protein
MWPLSTGNPYEPQIGLFCKLRSRNMREAAVGNPQVTKVPPNEKHGNAKLQAIQQPVYSRL